jgi:hypothetical protein
LDAASPVRPVQAERFREWEGCILRVDSGLGRERWPTTNSSRSVFGRGPTASGKRKDGRSTFRHQKQHCGRGSYDTRAVHGSSVRAAGTNTLVIWPHLGHSCAISPGSLLRGAILTTSFIAVPHVSTTEEDGVFYALVLFPLTRAPCVRAVPRALLLYQLWTYRAVRSLAGAICSVLLCTQRGVWRRLGNLNGLGAVGDNSNSRSSHAWRAASAAWTSLSFSTSRMSLGSTQDSPSSA